MTVTVDDQPLPAERLGLKTVGQVLAHLQRDGNRLVVHVLIDGEEPDLDRLAQIKQAPLAGHSLYIETANPREMALDVLAEVEKQLDEADRLKTEAADLLQRNQTTKALERLSGCFTTWQHAQESVLKTAQLLRIDLATIRVGERALHDVLVEFTGQLRTIREALEARDYVSLGDVLLYEMTGTCEQWRAALIAMRAAIGTSK
jgi:hypothetical protein